MVDKVRPGFILGAGLVLAALLLYWPSLHGDFVVDDRLLLTTDRLDRVGPLSAFRDNSWNLAGKGRHYRPVFGQSLALDRFLWGQDPTGFHVTNALCHAWLVLSLVLWMRGRGLDWTATIVLGAAFMCHPIHVETVAWICGRTDLLAAAFCMASLLALQRRRFFPAAILFFMGLGCKEVALAFLLALGPAWLAQRRRLDGWQPGLLATSIPALGVYAALRLTAQTGAASYPFAPPGSVTEWLVVMRETLSICRIYIQTLLFGQRIPYLAYDEIHAAREKVHADWSVILGRFSHLEGLASLLVVALVVVLAWRLIRRVPETTYGLALALFSVGLSLNLTSGLGAVMFNERYLFVATLGLVMALVEVWRVSSEKVRKAILGVVALAVIPWAVISCRRQIPYRGPVPFVETSITEAPGSGIL